MKLFLKSLAFILLTIFPFFHATAEKEGSISRLNWKENIGSANVNIINHIGDVRLRFGGYENVLEVVSLEQHNESKGVLKLEKSRNKEENIYTLEVVRIHEGNRIELDQNDKARIDFSVFVPLGRETRVKTRNGTIQVKGMKDKIYLETVGGEITGGKNKNLISAKSQSGNINFILSNHGVKGEQTFITETGDISINISEQAQHQVELYTSSNITTDFSIEIEDLTMQEPDKKGVAMVNGGGDLIKISSKRGNVSIRKTPK